MEWSDFGSAKPPYAPSRSPVAHNPWVNSPVTARVPADKFDRRGDRPRHGLAAFVPMSSASAGMVAGPQLVTTYQSPEGYPIYLYVLKNGHRLMVENRPSDAVTLRTFVNVGSINENPLYQSAVYGATGFSPGIAHLDEHCHFLTTRNFPAKNSWVGAVEKFGAGLNASTSMEWVQHELHFNREDTESMLDLHAESVLRPTYKDAETRQEKTNVLNEMNQRMAPVEYRVLDKLSQLLFDRPHSQTLGSPESVMQTRSEELEAFHQRFYTPENMLTVVSGRVNPAQVAQQVERLFGNNPPKAGSYNTAALRPALMPGQIRHATVTDPGLTHSMVKIGFLAPASANLKERVAMEFLLELLARSSSSLLETQLKDQQRLAFSVVGNYTPAKQTGEASVLLQTQPGKEQAALASALESIRALSQYQVTPEKLAQTRDTLINRFKAGLNHAEEASFNLGMEFQMGSLPYYLQYEALVTSITPEDLMMTARKYLDPNTYAVVFGVPVKSASGPPAQGASVLSKGSAPAKGMATPGKGMTTPWRPA